MQQFHRIDSIYYWSKLVDVCNLYHIFLAADSMHDSNESDDEFQICEVCNGEEVALPASNFLLAGMGVDQNGSNSITCTFSASEFRSEENYSSALAVVSWFILHVWVHPL